MCSCKHGTFSVYLLTLLMRAKKPPSRLSGRGLNSCYHLILQTAHTGCLTEYSHKITRAIFFRRYSPAITCIPPSRPTKHTLPFCREAPRCIHGRVPARLSSAGCSLSVSRSTTCSLQRLSYIVCKTSLLYNVYDIFLFVNHFLL